MKKLMPKTLNISGLKYDVEFPYTPETNDAILGTHVWPYLKIRVVGKYNNKKRPWCKIHEVLIHEILHAVDFMYGTYIGMDHSMLTQFGIGWYQVLVDNELNLKEGELPKTVKVGGFTYKVIHPYAFKDECDTCYSSSHNEAGLFRLSTEGVEGDYADSFIKMNLVELIMYSIGYVYVGESCTSDMSAIISRMSCGLYQVFVDNNIEELIKLGAEKDEEG